MITELFYSHIPNMNRGSLHTGSFWRIHLSVFKYRVTKNGFEGQKSFRNFRETGPCSGHEPFFYFREVCQKPPVKYLHLSIIVSKAFLVQIVSILHEKVTRENCQEILVARKQKGFQPLRGETRLFQVKPVCF